MKIYSRVNLIFLIDGYLKSEYLYRRIWTIDNQGIVWAHFNLLVEGKSIPPQINIGRL